MVCQFVSSIRLLQGQHKCNVDLLFNDSDAVTCWVRFDIVCSVLKLFMQNGLKVSDKPSNTSVKVLLLYGNDNNHSVLISKYWIVSNFEPAKLS